MVKNIPNKYTSNLLKEKINLRFKDKYDFFYLPMDFIVRLFKLAQVQYGICIHKFEGP